ncbi:BQ2448_6367 [Microbotryum intermedium]|uniref:BQ2448_6367 protein n=1 Tax=Microbotryum intermedium TaxID=269621 RepID=A0A238FL14_9BASI|nr:BQ2448_6367 [Microbotryum intermedium]
MKTSTLMIASWSLLSQFGVALAAQQGLRGVEQAEPVAGDEEASRVQLAHKRRGFAAADPLRHHSRWLAASGRRHHIARRDTSSCHDVWEDSETAVPCDDSVALSELDAQSDSQQFVQLDDDESSLADEPEEPFSADDEVVDEEETDDHGDPEYQGDDEVEDDEDDSQLENAQSADQNEHSSSSSHNGQTCYNYVTPDNNEQATNDDDDDDESTTNDNLQTSTDHYSYDHEADDDLNPDTATGHAERPASIPTSTTTTSSAKSSKKTSTTTSISTTSRSTTKKTTSTTSTSSTSKSTSTQATLTITSSLPVSTQSAGNSTGGSSGANSTIPGGSGNVTLNCTTVISFVNNTTPISNATLATNATAMNGTDVNPVGANVTVCVPITTNTTTNATTPPVPVPSYPCNSTNKVPSEFRGTAAGFASTCSVRYCDPNSRYTDTLWGTTKGNVTRLEIESALGLLSRIPPVWVNGIGNVLANGYLGEASRAAGQMYQVTGDRRALDLTLQMAENTHWLQNDPVNGTVMWTGRRDPVWPTTALAANPKAQLQYAGSENGYIVGNMILPALYILKQPCLWNMTPTRVGGWAGPSKFNANNTYLDRARELIAAGRLTYDVYFVPWFFDKNGNVIQPNDPRWNLVGDAGSSNKAGLPMAFNRRALLLDGMSKLASAYEHPMMLDAPVTEYYDQLIKTNLRTFVNDMERTKTLNGTLPSYDWDYVVGKNNTEEVRGIHGWFDVYWFFMSWQRNAAYYNMTTDLMTALANTMQYTIYQGNNTFSGFVDGHSTVAEPAVTVLSAGWAYYAYWLPEWFATVANANSVNFMKVPMYSIPLIWVKNAIATDNWLTGVETMSNRTIVLPPPFPAPGNSTTGGNSTTTANATIPTSTISLSSSTKGTTSSESTATSKTSMATSKTSAATSKTNSSTRTPISTTSGTFTGGSSTGNQPSFVPRLDD